MAEPLGQSVPWLIGRARVALDVDELAAAGVDDLAAADRAVGADRLGRLQALRSARRPSWSSRRRRGGPMPQSAMRPRPAPFAAAATDYPGTTPSYPGAAPRTRMLVISLMRAVGRVSILDICPSRTSRSPRSTSAPLARRAAVPAAAAVALVVAVVVPRRAAAGVRRRVSPRASTPTRAGSPPRPSSSCSRSAATSLLLWLVGRRASSPAGPAREHRRSRSAAPPPRGCCRRRAPAARR